MAEALGYLSPIAAGMLCQHDRAGINHIVCTLLTAGGSFFRPDLRQSTESRGQPVQPPAKRLVAGEVWKPLQQVLFCVVVDRLSRQ